MPVEPIKKLRTPAEREMQLRRNVEEMNSAVLNNLADVAVDVAPVDTATYITSFAIYEGDSLGSIPKLYSSIGKTGGQDYSQYAGIGRAKLTAMIENLDHSTGSYVFGNESEHRWDVEVALNYGVFKITRENFPVAVRAAKVQTGLK